jgi:hypothetical protein
MSNKVRAAIGGFGGAMLGLLLGGAMGGIAGFMWPHLGQEPPQGNPTEQQFFHFLLDGIGVLVGLAGATIGGAVGAALGAAVVAAAAVKGRRDTHEAASKSDRPSSELPNAESAGTR